MAVGEEKRSSRRRPAPDPSCRISSSPDRRSTAAMEMEMRGKRADIDRLDCHWGLGPLSGSATVRQKRAGWCVGEESEPARCEDSNGQRARQHTHSQPGWTRTRPLRQIACKRPHPRPTSFLVFLRYCAAVTQSSRTLQEPASPPLSTPSCSIPVASLDAAFLAALLLCPSGLSLLCPLLHYSFAHYLPLSH